MDLRSLEIDQSLMDKSEFTANGVKYKIIKRTDLSIDRYHILHGYSEQIMRAMADDAINKILDTAIGHCKKNNVFDLSVYLHEQKQSNMLYKLNPDLILEACTTFIVREDEDQKLYDPTIKQQKINDWKVEGMSFEGFFLLLLTRTSKLLKIWQHFSQSILNQIQEEKESLNSETLMTSSKK